MFPMNFPSFPQFSPPQQLTFNQANASIGCEELLVHILSSKHHMAQSMGILCIRSQLPLLLSASPQKARLPRAPLVSSLLFCFFFRAVLPSCLSKKTCNFSITTLLLVEIYQMRRRIVESSPPGLHPFDPSHVFDETTGRLCLLNASTKHKVWISANSQH